MNRRPDPSDPEHLDIEARLRATLAEEASTIEPSTDGLNRIEEKLMSEPTTDNSTRRWILGGSAAAVAAILVVVGLVFALDDDDDADVTSDTTTSTTLEETTTTAEATTTTAANETTAPFAPAVDPYGVAYPSPLTSQRFESPDAVARAYATDVLGYTDLVLGEFRQGDTRSGEVPITAREGGPETIVLVRQMEDDSWYALGSQAPDITVETPEAGDEITSPFETTGSALAFEGTVNVVVRAQDDPAILGEGIVMGSGVPPAGPFAGEISFDPPTEERPGIVVYQTRSAEDGHVEQATSFPVRLQP